VFAVVARRISRRCGPRVGIEAMFEPVMALAALA